MPERVILYPLKRGSRSPEEFEAAVETVLRRHHGEHTGCLSCEATAPPQPNGTNPRFQLRDDEKR